jgi:hypothetical protein
MMSTPRHLHAGAVVTIGVILLLCLMISKTSRGAPPPLNQMPNKTMVKNATHTGQQRGEVDLRMPAALWFSLQEGDLDRDISATELRVPSPLRLRLQMDKRVDTPPVVEKPEGP